METSVAIKFRREGSLAQAVGTHGHTGRPLRRVLTPKQRLLYIYVGILVFCILMLVYKGLGLDQAFSPLPEAKGPGIVTEKREIPVDAGGSRFLVTVEVFVPGELSSEDGVSVRLDPMYLSDEVEVPFDSYERVEPGTLLNVRYRLNRSRNMLIVNGLDMMEQPPEEVLEGETLDVEFVPGENDSSAEIADVAAAGEEGGNP